MSTTFQAPWGKTIRWVSGLATVLLLVLAGFFATLETVPPLVRVVVPGFCLALLIGTALFTVRRYEVRGRVLRIQRLLWWTEMPLQKLAAVEFRPGPFGWAWRTCGNGGMFSFSGWYYQKPMGTFRALATKFSDAVILKFEGLPPLVVTPDQPEAFAQAVRSAAQGSPKEESPAAAS